MQRKWMSLMWLMLALLMVALLQVTPTAPAIAQDGGTPPPDSETDTPDEPDYNQPGTYVNTVAVDGTLRGYLLHIPPGFDPEQPTPLVLSYHGFISDPVQHATGTGWMDVADDEGFIIVFPAGQREPMGWYTQPGAVEAGWLDDVQFSREMLDQLRERYNIDPRRIYITGFSNGGGMVHRLACDFSSEVAAVAPVSGPHFYGDPCDLERPVPIFGIYGMWDNSTKWEGYYDLLMPIPEWIQGWVIRNGCDPEPTETRPEELVLVQQWGNCDEGADVVLRIYEQGRHTWQPGSAEHIWEFFEAHPMPEIEDETDDTVEE